MSTFTRMFGRTAIAALAIVSLTACSKDGDDANEAASTDSANVSAPTPAPAVMTDANILAAMMAGDSMEIEYASGVKSMATSSDLKTYGAMLNADHSKHLTDVMALAAKDSISPVAMADDTTSLHTQHLKTTMAAMTKGAATDSAFVAEAINGHQAMLDKLNAADGAAQNTDVKALIASTRPVVQKHLDDARALLDKLNGK